MQQPNPIEELFDRLNKIFPNINLEPEKFSGYFFKTISTSECLYSTKRTAGKQSGQYHLAVTNLQENMTLFPVVTSFEYLNQRNSKYKQAITSNYALSLYVPNLIAKANYIRDNYHEISELLDKKDPKEALVPTEAEYIQISEGLHSYQQKSNWLPTTFNVVLSLRKTGQHQIEIDSSTINQAEEFKMFRKLHLDGDWLLILKRKGEASYVFLLISNDEFTAHNMAELRTFYKENGVEKMTIHPYVSLDENQAEEVDSNFEEPNIYFYSLNGEVPELNKSLEVIVEKNELLDCKQEDLIYLYSTIDGQECFVGIGEVQAVEIEELNVKFEIKIIQKINNIPLKELVEEGYIGSEVFASETSDGAGHSVQVAKSDDQEPDQWNDDDFFEDEVRQMHIRM